MAPSPFSSSPFSFAVRAHAQALVVACVLLLAAASVWLMVALGGEGDVAAAFWFEPMTYGASEAMVDRLGGPITPAEMTRIAAVARFELRAAYAGLRVTFSDRRDARYRVRVLQDLQPPLAFPRGFAPAGQSASVALFGGDAAVSFRTLVNHAISTAPPGTDRATMIDGIGRGIGRAAAHELAHQILHTERFHASTDVQSYEYASADRPEQYYGPMHWDIAWPLLLERVGEKR